MTRLGCMVFGHKWIWRDEPSNDGGIYVAPKLLDPPLRCDRCGHYDDEPSIVRAANRRAWRRRWTPISISISRKAISVGVGIPYHVKLPRLWLRVALHYGWERYSEGPGIHASLTIWRLSLGGWIGGFWQDEDGEGRALFRLWADFQTYGWRYLTCWGGHDFDEASHGYRSCRRCDHSEKVETTDEVIAA